MPFVEKQVEGSQTRRFALLFGSFLQEKKNKGIFCFFFWKFNFFYAEKIFLILMSETEALEQTFMRGDAQYVKTIILQTIKDEIVEIRLAYS